MAKISVNNLEKSYNGSPVLAGVTFSAQSGEIIALLGGSGAGKSTLLRCLNLLEKPSGGGVEIGETRVEFFRPPLENERGTAKSFTRQGGHGVPAI